jgi:hypothetical protein
MEVNASSTRIPTPNVAKMAANGMKFARGYSGQVRPPPRFPHQGLRWLLTVPVCCCSRCDHHAQVCAPSRTMLMTGKHLGHTTIRGNDGAYTPLLATDVIVAKVLQEEGYHTGPSRHAAGSAHAFLPASVCLRLQLLLLQLLGLSLTALASSRRHRGQVGPR